MYGQLLLLLSMGWGRITIAIYTVKRCGRRIQRAANLGNNSLGFEMRPICHFLSLGVLGGIFECYYP